MKYLTLCLLTAKAAIPEEVIYYQTDGKTKELPSYALKPSDSFGSCTCDLTVGACDDACCCDPDCSS